MKPNDLSQETDRIDYYAAVLNVAFYAAMHPEFDVTLHNLVPPGGGDPTRFAHDVNVALDRLGWRAG